MGLVWLGREVEAYDDQWRTTAVREASSSRTTARSWEGESVARQGKGVSGEAVQRGRSSGEGAAVVVPSISQLVCGAGASVWEAGDGGDVEGVGAAWEDACSSAACRASVMPAAA
nr:MAG TPA: hypothetical protein [Caudoviricetes sp.]